MESGTAEQSYGRVRIAIVAPSLKWVGGQSVQADLVVRHWQTVRAVEARFVPIDPTLPRWLAWTGSIPYLRTALRMPFYLMALWRALGEVEIAHIFSASYWSFMLAVFPAWLVARLRKRKTVINYRSEEHTSELQSRLHLVCRLLLEKKKREKVQRLVDLQRQNNEACRYVD